jgi:hypothetical protein
MPPSEEVKAKPVLHWLRYVPHSLRSEYEAKGWVISNEMEDTNHGQWSVLMIYEGEGDPE